MKLKEFLKKLDPTTFVVVCMNGCSMSNIVENHLKNEILCSNKIKKIYKHTDAYVIDLYNR